MTISRNKPTKQEVKDKKVLIAALAVLKRQKTNQKCKAYGFACAQCNLAFMYAQFESYVNFWLE